MRFASNVPFLRGCSGLAGDSKRRVRDDRSSSSDPWARNASGFTILEVALYLSILLVIGGPLISLVLASTRSTAENDAYSRVVERNRTAIFRFEKELRKGMSGSAVVSGAGSIVTFTSAAGFDGNAPIPGPQVAFFFRVSQGETLNGVDDDGNGIADEGDFVRRDLSTGMETAISNAIDMTNSGFSMTGAGVTITVTSFASLDKRYGVFSVSNSLTVFPRN